MKRAKKIIDNVYWVGVRDLNNRHFHGDLYPIDEGCTYNAYLVVDDVKSIISSFSIQSLIIQVDSKRFMPSIQMPKYMHPFLERRI